MAVVVSNFTAPTSTGNFSITGLPFEPVAVLFFSIEADQGNPSNSFGACTGAGEEFCIWTAMGDQATTYNQRYNETRDDRCLLIYSNTSVFVTEQVSATCVSMDSDGFTLNFITGGNSVPISYMALGGNNISEAEAGVFTAGASTGTTAVTGMGFEPNALIVAHTASDGVNGREGNMCWGVGVTDGTNQYSSWAFAYQGNATAADSYHRTDAVACAFVSASGFGYHSELNSFDTGGFTVDVIDAGGYAIPHGYLAVKAAAAKAGNGVQPDSTGIASFTTAGFKPGGVLFCWNGHDTPGASGTTRTAGPVRPGVGATTVTGDESISMIHRASAPFGAYVPDAYWNAPGATPSARCINLSGAGSQVDPGPHAGQGWAKGDSLYQGGFDLDWDTVTSGADRAFGWLALPGDIEGTWIPRFYRRGPRG